MVDHLNLTDGLRSFFENELVNVVGSMNQGTFTLADPATLGSAHDSLEQAPPEIIVEWFEGDLAAIEGLVKFVGLMTKYGHEVKLRHLLDRDEEERRLRAQGLDKQATIVYPLCICGHRYDHHQDPGDPRGKGCYRCDCMLYEAVPQRETS